MSKKTRVVCQKKPEFFVQFVAQATRITLGALEIVVECHFTEIGQIRSKLEIQGNFLGLDRYVIMQVRSSLIKSRDKLSSGPKIRKSKRQTLEWAQD